MFDVAAVLAKWPVSLVSLVVQSLTKGDKVIKRGKDDSGTV
jgi:hypothetical protein